MRSTRMGSPASHGIQWRGTAAMSRYRGGGCASSACTAAARRASVAAAAAAAGVGGGGARSDRAVWLDRLSSTLREPAAAWADLVERLARQAHVLPQPVNLRQCHGHISCRRREEVVENVQQRIEWQPGEVWRLCRVVHGADRCRGSCADAWASNAVQSPPAAPAACVGRHRLQGSRFRVVSLLRMSLLGMCGLHAGRPRPSGAASAWHLRSGPQPLPASVATRRCGLGRHSHGTKAASAATGSEIGAPQAGAGLPEPGAGRAEAGSGAHSG